MSCKFYWFYVIGKVKPIHALYTGKEECSFVDLC